MIFNSNDIQLIRIDNGIMTFIFRSGDDNYAFECIGELKKVKQEFVKDGKTVRKSIQELIINDKINYESENK
jgi:hypothetical protein